MTQAPSPARVLAASVLVRVDDEASYAAAALAAAFDRGRALSARDRGLATELVYGVLRTEQYLASRLRALSGKGRGEPDGFARAHLLMGAYTLCFLDRVPSFAAVTEAVLGVRAAAGDHAGRYAHALLRRLEAELAEKGRPSLGDAIALSLPGWLTRALGRSLGKEAGAAFARAGAEVPPIGLYVIPPLPRDEFADSLRPQLSEGASLTPCPHASRGLLLRGAGDPRAIPGQDERYVVQEEGAQLVAELAGARPGERVLDACSGRGNKLRALLSAVLPGGSIDAADLHAAKVAMSAAGPRAAWTRARYVVDWTRGSSEVPDDFDRVLVDAPCSGVGTLRRRPEIARGRPGSSLAELSALQAAIVLGAAKHVRPGGHLVYAVCSVLREEAEDVVAAVVKEAVSRPEGRFALVPVPFEAPVAATLAEPGVTSLRLLPQVHGTDGYFVASFCLQPVAVPVSP